MPGTLRTAASWLSSALWRKAGGRGGIARPAAGGDWGPHRVPVEWWYTVGQLDATDRGPAQRLAFELTLARMSDPLVSRVSGWAAVFSFIDPQRGAYRVAERLVFPPASPLEVDGPRLSFRVADRAQRARAEDWVLEGDGARWHLRARLPDGRGVDLDLAATRPAARFGDDGVVDYGGRETMAWVAQTRLEATGTAFDGGQVRPVRGLAWMDHQWGGPWLDGYVWKVTSVHLDQGDDVLAFRMEDRAGALVAARCARVSPDGSVRQVGTAGIVLRDRPPPFRYGRHTYRPTTHLQAPALGLDLDITPLLLDQRKHTGAALQAFPIWWEGACDARGTVDGQPASGRAFVEIAGVE